MTDHYLGIDVQSTAENDFDLHPFLENKARAELWVDMVQDTFGIIFVGLCVEGGRAACLILIS